MQRIKDSKSSFEPHHRLAQQEEESETTENLLEAAQAKITALQQELAMQVKV